MKKNYKRLLPLLIALPALMANAPAPQVFQNDYKDYTLTYVKSEQDGDNYNYTYHLKNTGVGYISYIHLEYETRNDYYGCSYHTHYRGTPFYDTLIEPGFDADIVMSAYKEIPDVKKLKQNCQGYSTFDESVKISGTKALTLKSYQENKYYYYKIDLALEYSDSNWNYGAVLKLNYNDSVYYVKVDERNGYSIETNAKLDLTKLSILDTTVIKSRPYMYGIMDGFAIIAIVFIVCFFVLIGGGIFAAIFIPTIVRRKRRRRAALLAKKQNK